MNSKVTLPQERLADIDAFVDRAQQAARAFRKLDQEQVDHIVWAMVTAGLDAAVELAEVAYEETGFGVLEDKVVKNYVATEFLYDYLKDKKSVGVIEEDAARGIELVAEPVGVVLAITPITMSVSGGTGGPYTWSATGLPPGLAIRSADGMITGTPTVAGTYTVTLHANDGVAAATATFAFTVAAPLAPSDTSQALAAVGLDLLRADPRLHVHPGLVPSGATLPYVVVWSSISRAPDDDQDDAARQRMVRWSCHSVGANADAATMVAGWVADAMLTGEKPVVAGFDCGPVYEDQGPVPLPPNETLGTAVYDVSVVYAMTATS